MIICDEKQAHTKREIFLIVQVFTENKNAWNSSLIRVKQCHHTGSHQDFEIKVETNMSLCYLDIENWLSMLLLILLIFHDLLCSRSNCWYVGMLTLMANSIGSQILKGPLSWVYQASVHLISDEQGAHKDQSPTNCHQMYYWSVSNFKLDRLRKTETSWLWSNKQPFTQLTSSVSYKRWRTIVKMLWAY